MLIFRYESDARVDVTVTEQSSTYIEFKLKRNDYLADNQDSSKVKDLYNQSKEFIFHRTIFLIIAGVCGSLIECFKHHLFSFLL